MEGQEQQQPGNEQQQSAGPPQSKKKRSTKKKGAKGGNGASAGEKGAGSQQSAPPPNEQDSASMMANVEADREAKQLLEYIADRKRKRSEVNADITAARKKLYAMGHTRDAVALIERFRNMDEEQRSAVDLSFNHLRRAMQMPLDDDLFAATKSVQH